MPSLLILAVVGSLVMLLLACFYRLSLCFLTLCLLLLNFAITKETNKLEVRNKYIKFSNKLKLVGDYVSTGNRQQYFLCFF